MNLPYQLFIALRHLKSKKRHKGISFNAIISIGGITVGVMALLVVLSVMNGFHGKLREKILGANAHAVVLNLRGAIEDHNQVMERLKDKPQIVSMSPFVLGQVMVSSGQRAHGVFMRGIEPASELKTTDILKYLSEGSVEDLITTPPSPPLVKGGNGGGAQTYPWIILGRELASMLGVMKGDVINVLSPMGEIGPLGMLPRIKNFQVAGIFEMGMFEYDMNLVLTDIKAAGDFFGYGDAVTGIGIRVDDIYRADQVSKAVNERLGFPYYARDWIQMNRNLFSALKLEKFAMFIILTLIILVASFNIISTLMMNVMEKQKEIAILKAMGATNHGIMMVFMMQGLFIGIVGTTLGVIGGYVLGSIIHSYEIIKLPADVYYLSSLPVKMKPFDFIVVSFSAIVISFLSTIYPSYHAARLNPVEPLRYE
jgi:lipoprotein-releasing system permease protein